MSDFSEYAGAWQRMMVNIWQDRIMQAGAVDTGTLLRSVRAGASRIGEADASMAFQFVRYGVYVDAGVGNGYRRGNGGQLEFLRKSTRIERGLGKERQRTRWLTTSWAISRRVLLRKTADIVKDTAAATLATLH